MGFGRLSPSARLGTTNCQTVDNVLVDTGSIGLRILNSALTTVPASSLGTITKQRRSVAGVRPVWGHILHLGTDVASRR